jgi:rubrerythrin
MAKEAYEEGFEEIAEMFEGIAKVEKKHERRYKKLLKNIEDGKVFKKDGKIYWKCRNCGYIHEGVEASDCCPVCKHPTAYFEVWAENY